MIVAVDERPDVLAIVPTLGGNIPRLQECLASICASTFDGRLAIVVVWNDPRQSLVDLGPVTVLQTGLNLGYVGGIRHAQRSVTAPRLWIIQDDMTVDPECLPSLVNRQNRSDNPAVVSPVYVDVNGCVPVGSRGGIISNEGLMECRFPFADTLPSDLDLSVRLDWLQLGRCRFLLPIDAGGDEHCTGTNCSIQPQTKWINAKPLSSFYGCTKRRTFSAQVF